MVSSSRCHIPWTVVQVEDGLTFLTLFLSIKCGAHPRLTADEQLSASNLNKVFVGHTKESLSVVDEWLIVNDVCSVFGSHIKYLVQLVVQEMPQNSTQTVLRNTFICTNCHEQQSPV